MRDNVTDTLFYFLRVGLFGVQGDSVPPVQLEQLDWQQLYDTAKAQGVLAIVFDGVKRVMEALGDNSLGMPRSLKMRWLSVVDSIEKKNINQRRAMEFISKACDKAGIRVMTFKGLSLGRFYAEPLHRECGDIDLYALDGRHRDLNRLITDLGGSVIHSSAKHSEIKLRSVMIESHNYFVYRYLSKRAKAVNSRLVDSVCSAEPYGENSSLYYPNSEFDTLFVIYHAANHFKFEGISLRHIIDWCYVVQRAGCNLSQLAEYGLERFSAVLCRIGKHSLGFDLPEHLCRCDDKTYNRVLSDIVGSNVGKDGKKVSPLTLLRRKAVRFFSRHWAYSLVGDSFLGGVVNSVIAHIAEPMAIFRGNK
ncbi:MAG: nucleotidyltransferase family protein [Alistipes sp.]|nr:nucleotidyltransferase family protein [Alistipes sp.]